MNEIEGIKNAYERRAVEKDKAKLYSFFNSYALYSFQRMEKETLNLLKKYSIIGLQDKKIFEIGCGTGGGIMNFIKYGTKHANLYGIDLLPDMIKEAKRFHPNINFIQGNAEKLPFKKEIFDIVRCVVVFTSVLDSKMRKNIASEMLRVLKHEGVILWFDWFVNNPKNPNAKAVKKHEIFELFPDCRIYLKRIIIAPPIGRIIAPISTILCELLEKMPFLCAYYIGIITKR